MPKENIDLLKVIGRFKYTSLNETDMIMQVFSVII